MGPHNIARRCRRPVVSQRLRHALGSRTARGRPFRWLAAFLFPWAPVWPARLDSLRRERRCSWWALATQ
mgnify:CR=1 FL=1|jgi:hypothetical protein